MGWKMALDWTLFKEGGSTQAKSFLLFFWAHVSVKASSEGGSGGSALHLYLFDLPRTLNRPKSKPIAFKGLLTFEGIGDSCQVGDRDVALNKASKWLGNSYEIPLKSYLFPLKAQRLFWSPLRPPKGSWISSQFGEGKEGRSLWSDVFASFTPYQRMFWWNYPQILVVWLEHSLEDALQRLGHWIVAWV